MRIISLHLLLLASLASIASAQTCFQIHGRAVDYRGDGFFAIWHIGTHHEFFPADNKSADLICNYFDCESGDRQPALFADFTVCPTEAFVHGAAQSVIVTAVERPHVVPDWPPQKSSRDFLNDFLSWYVPRARTLDSDKPWRNTLRLMHWDLSAELATALEADSAVEGAGKRALPPGFDPLLNSDQPAEHYEVGLIEQRGGHYRAKVFRATEGKRGDAPDAIVEFVRQDENWFFINVEYPNSGSDLLSMLKAPRLASASSRVSAAK